MLVRYWQPYREIETLRRQFDRIFDDFTNLTQGDTEQGWSPAIELKDAGDTLVLRAQLPGLDAKDLDVQVTREAVALSGEYRYEQKTEDKNLYKSEFRYGKFQRVVSLPIAIQNDKIQAEYKDGILSLTLPKVVEAQNKVVKLNLAELSQSPNPQTLEAGSN